MTTTSTFSAPARLITDSDNAQLDGLLDHVVETVQLTPTQYESARQKYEAVAEWLSAEGSIVRVLDPHIYPQGSLRIGTTVKPLSAAEFDLDLVCELAASPSLGPSDAYDLLWSRMHGNIRYQPILEKCPRCIRINYANDFHLDIVPAIPDPKGIAASSLLIPDREKQRWHPSNPKGYAEWFEEKARLPIYKGHTLGALVEPLRAPEPAGAKPPLKLAVQLLKRWRDVAFSGREEAPPPSIVLTTIAGHLYGKESHVTDAVTAILAETLAWSRRAKISLSNPANPGESVTERWHAEPGAYDAFLAELQMFSDRWQALVRQGTLVSIGEELKRLFGERQVTGALKAYAESLTRARQAGNLRVSPKTGTLVTAGAAQAIRIPSHTFHGGRDDT